MLREPKSRKRREPRKPRRERGRRIEETKRKK